VQSANCHGCAVVYSFGYPFPVYPKPEYSGSELYLNILLTRYVVNIRVPPIYSGPMAPNIRSVLTECQIWSYGFSPSVFGSVHGTVYVLSYVSTGTLGIPAGLLLSSLALALSFIFERAVALWHSILVGASRNSYKRFCIFYTTFIRVHKCCINVCLSSINFYMCINLYIFYARIKNIHLYKKISA